jgi:hypothetical protein
MQIHYQLTLEDVLAFNWYHIRNSKRLRRGYYFNQACVILGALVATMFWSKGSFSLRLLVFLIAAAVGMVLYHLYYEWWIRHSSKKLYAEGQNKGVLGNHILAIDSEGVLEISDVGESRTMWSGIEKIEENDQYVFIYVGALQAHIIPKRAFMSENEAARFSQLAQTHQAETRRMVEKSF